MFLQVTQQIDNILESGFHYSRTTQKTRIINPVLYHGWDDFLLSSDETSFFHTSAWVRVLHDSYGYTPLYLASTENKRFNILIPMMEINSPLTGKRGISLPFTDFCPLLGCDASSFELALQKIIRYGKKSGWRYIEFRSGENFPKYGPAYISFYVHQLDLNRDHKEIFSSFKGNTRRNIRKAERNGLAIEFSHKLDAVKSFYKLHCITRKRHGVPPQPFSFFKNIHKHVISKAKGIVITAKHENMPVAAAIFFYFGGQAIYKYGASDFKYQALRANNLVMWEAIKYFSRKRFITFHFGRTEPENKGLLQFKRGWGTREKILNYYRYYFKNEKFVKGFHADKHGIFNEIMQRLPIPVLRVIGAVLYPHVA